MAMQRYLYIGKGRSVEMLQSHVLKRCVCVRSNGLGRYAGSFQTNSSAHIISYMNEISGGGAFSQLAACILFSMQNVVVPNLCGHDVSLAF